MRRLEEQQEAAMHRLPQILIVVILLVLGFYVGQPYLDRMLFSASTPRAVTPRGSLADIERTTIELFERVSPSVVQVVARAGGPEAMQSEPTMPRANRAPDSSGTPPATSSPTITSCTAPIRSRCGSRPGAC